MYYTLAESAPWQKTVTATVSAEEVDKVFEDLEERYRVYARSPGFRKGKVTREIVRSQFKEAIVQEASTQIMDRQALVVLSDIKLEPVTQMDMHMEGPLARGESFSYAFSFYYLPDFALPDYAGIPVTMTREPLEDREVEAVLENLRRTTPVEVAVSIPRKPADGDIANIDFEVREVNGSVCGKMHGKGTRVLIGGGGALQAFESVLKRVMLGEELEEQVTFPQNFADPTLAGKNKKLYIKLQSLMERVPSRLDDDLAKRVNPEYRNVSMLRKAVEEELTLRKEASFRQSVEEQLLDVLLAQTDIPLPEGMVQRYQGYIIADIHAHMARTHKAMGDMGRDEERLAQEVRPEAERLCQRQLLLLRVAKKEGIIVSDAEMQAHIRHEAARTGVAYPQALAEYTGSGNMLALRDRLLAAKAMDIVYRKAHVQFEHVLAAQAVV